MMQDYITGRIFGALAVNIVLNTPYLHMHLHHPIILFLVPVVYQSGLPYGSARVVSPSKVGAS